MGKRPDIVFVYPPATTTSAILLRTHFQMNLGAAYVTAYVRQKGFTASHFLAQDRMSAGRCAARLVVQNPRLIGFTVYNSNYTLCQVIARNVKRLDPGILIVFGGPTPTVSAEAILKNNPFVDVCVKNEGEETCLELLALLDNTGFDLEQAGLEAIRGIAFRRGDDIVVTPARDVLLANRKVADFLDSYPSPYLDGVMGASGVGIITARGCSQNCVYCNCATISKRAVSTHSVDRVIGELDYIAANRQDDRLVDIFDDTFTLLPDRSLEICKRIIENKIDLPLSCMTRCDCVDEALLETMKEAGFQSIGFSLESAVPRVLREIGKVRHPRTRADETFEKEKDFVEKFKKYAAYAKKIGIKTVFASIMVGLPTETPGEGKQTLDVIREMGDNLDFYAHNVLRIYPGSPIFFNHKEQGYSIKFFDNGVHFRTFHPYEAERLPAAPRSIPEIDGIKEDCMVIRTFSLTPEGGAAEKEEHRYFSNVILLCDTITPDMVSWFRDYLDINGYIIQVYTNFDRAMECYRGNEETLANHQSPSNYHAEYYRQPGKNGAVTLVPLRTYFLGGQAGVTIGQVNTAVALAPGSDMNPKLTVCLERKKDDTLRLHRLLEELADSGSSLGDLFSRPFYPYFSALCRWETTVPNCKTLETIIIGQDHNIKTCWNGEPVGKVGEPFEEIKAKIEQMHREAEARRNCTGCAKRTACSQCLFPAPLNENEYCQLKTQHNVEEAAGMIRTFDIFKES